MAIFGTVVPGETFGFRNRIINGDMRIDQRNAGASITPTENSFAVDRWKFRLNQASKFTAQQNAGSVTPPSGFVNYLGMSSSSAFSPAAGDFFNVQQNIEGFNVSDLGWGTANAKSIVLSFWVRSSLTGTFAGRVANSTINRNYVFTFSISVADTWEYKTISIAGDTSGTWLTTNGLGFQLAFDLGSGSTFETASPNSWLSVDAIRTASSVRLIATNGATFYITGVQLEVGSVATPFERRPYGTELMLCSRYFQKITASGFTSLFLATARGTGSAEARGAVIFPVQMRSSPSLSSSGTFRITDDHSNATTVSTISSAQIYSSCALVLATGTGNLSWAGTNQAVLVTATNAGEVALLFAAEL